MPENYLRPNLFEYLKCKNIKVNVIKVERCWVDVAVSISKFCVTDWYGYKSVKWLNLCRQTEQIILSQC